MRVYACQFSENELVNPLLQNSDLIELGLPFTDPIADGPTIQKSNNVSVCLVLCIVYRIILLVER